MWHSEIWKGPWTEKWQFQGGGAFVQGAEDFLPESLLEMNYGRLFTYMYRRFGWPEYGSDPYKEIANWFITTPDPAVVLLVTPKPSGARYSFSHGLNGDVFTDWRSDELRERAIKALGATVLDLLTPTNVRDAYFNAMGRVPEEEVTETVPYCRWAGLGVDEEYFVKLEAEDAGGTAGD